MSVMSNKETEKDTPASTEEEENYDYLGEPPFIEAPQDHPLWPLIRAAIKEIYDPEIPVNIYELGLIYAVEIHPVDKSVNDILVKMSLTSPACPVAQDMPSWVQGAILPLDGVRGCEVELVWDPQWNPAMMAETAKMQLNMFM